MNQHLTPTKDPYHKPSPTDSDHELGYTARSGLCRRSASSATANLGERTGTHARASAREPRAVGTLVGMHLLHSYCSCHRVRPSRSEDSFTENLAFIHVLVPTCTWWGFSFTYGGWLFSLSDFSGGCVFHQLSVLHCNMSCSCYYQYCIFWLELLFWQFEK